MSKTKPMVHVSFDLVENFIPRVPRQICPNEDSTTPRICVAPDKLSALQAIPQAGEVIHTMKVIGIPVIIHAYYLKSGAVLMPEQIADKVPDATATREMWITDIPQSVYRIDYEIVYSYVPKRTDRNGTRERFVIYADFKRVKHQENWINLAYKSAKSDKAAEYFLKNKPDISFRTFMSNMDDELLKSLNIKLQEVRE